MVDLFITLFVVALLAGTATLIKYFKGEGMIAGYNTASSEDQKYMSEKGIGKFVGNYLYLLAAVILCGYLAKKAGFAWGHGLSWVLFTVIIIIMLIRARRFNPPGPPNRYSRVAVIVSIVFVLLIITGITWSALPSGYEFETGKFRITGAYGASMNYTDIESVRLDDQLPPIAMKINGVGLGPIAKGYFQTEKGESVRLFVRANRPPFLYITIKSKHAPIIINCREPQQTTALYKQLQYHID
ncbi:MAG: DUF3784 domain-containing protein [Syntrophomonas sp.]